jgi:hypothetical protein
MEIKFGNCGWHAKIVQMPAQKADDALKLFLKKPKTNLCNSSSTKVFSILE